MAHMVPRRTADIPTPPGAVVVVNNSEVTAAGATAANATAGFRFNTSGIAERRVGSVYSTEYTWRVSGASADYDIRFTHLGGTAPTGVTLNTWLNLGTSREFTIVDPIIDAIEDSSIVKAEISLAGAATPIDNGTIVLTSERV